MAQSAARKWLDPLLNIVLLSPILWAILHYLCSFPNVQALGLGILLAAIITRGIYPPEAKESASSSFRPYVFTIYPQVGRMLVDVGLLAEEELKAIRQDVPSYRPWTDKHLLHYGFEAYVISSEPGIVHYPEFGCYSTNLNLSIKVDLGFDIEPEPPSLRKFRSLPEFFIEPSIQSYALGIELPARWWEKNRDRALPGVVLHENFDYLCGRVRLTLARLSYEVGRSFYTECSTQYQDRVRKLVSEQGWTNTSRDIEGVRYLGEDYEHNYGLVTITALE
jgi:hypothetical protein